MQNVQSRDWFTVASMNADPSDWIKLQSQDLSALIDPQGAQLSVLRDAQGHDLLWNGDAAWWNGRAPILFPIVGALNGGHYRWRGKPYALPRHGFARGRRFDVVSHDGHQALFRQTADDATRQVYPFAYELDVSIMLEDKALSITAGVLNTGKAVLPASIGFHPAFRWPLPYGAARDSHYLEFEKDERAPIRRLDAAGLLTTTRHSTPVRGKRLKLDDALFVEDVVIFDELQSSAVIYGAERGPRIRVSFPGATHLGLWSKPGAGFVCIEPWRGVADPVGFNREMEDKPGVFLVAPGARQSLQMRIEWLPAD
jgi:galactose mutarotase-like enzyme